MTAEVGPGAPGSATTGPVQSNGGTIIQPNDAAGNRPQRKWQRVLDLLIAGPHTSFEIERLAHDHCPNSTISELKHRRGLTIVSELVEVPGYAGEPAHIARYTLAQDSRERALQLLGGRHGADQGAR